MVCPRVVFFQPRCPQPAAEFLLGWFWGAVGSGLGQFVGTSGCLGLHHVLALSQLHHIQIVKLEWIRPR